MNESRSSALDERIRASSIHDVRFSVGVAVLVRAVTDQAQTTRSEAMPNYLTTRCTVTGPAADVAAFRDRMIVWDQRAEAYVDFGFDKMPARLREQLDSVAKKMAAMGGPHMRFDFDKMIPSPAIIDSVQEGNVSEDGARLMMLRGEYGGPSDTMGLRETSIQYYRDDVGMPDQAMREVAAAFLQKHPDYESEGRLRLQSLLETGHTGWYSWNLANWGTKSNARSFRLIGDEPLEFLFDTPWSFPWPVFEALAREFPTLQFKCVSFEEAWFFAGEGCFNPGEGESPYEDCDATAELYERVYGRRYEPASRKKPKRKARAKKVA